MKVGGNPELKHEPGMVIAHLHNTYLELLVQTGAIGLVLAGVLIALLLRGLVAAFQAGRLAADLYLFLLAAFVFLLLWSLFDFRILRQDCRLYWLLLAGTAFSFSLGADNPAAPESATAGEHG